MEAFLQRRQSIIGRVMTAPYYTEIYDTIIREFSILKIRLLPDAYFDILSQTTLRNTPSVKQPVQQQPREVQQQQQQTQEQPQGSSQLGRKRDLPKPCQQKKMLFVASLPQEFPTIEELLKVNIPEIQFVSIEKKELIPEIAMQKDSVWITLVAVDDRIPELGFWEKYLEQRYLDSGGNSVLVLLHAKSNNSACRALNNVELDKLTKHSMIDNKPMVINETVDKMHDMSGNGGIGGKKLTNEYEFVNKIMNLL